MVDPQQTVSALIGKVLAGREISISELKDAAWDHFPGPEDLKTEAWLALQQWIRDEDIRARDAEYAEMKRTHLRYLLERVENTDTQTP